MKRRDVPISREREKLDRKWGQRKDVREESERKRWLKTAQNGEIDERS